MLIDYVGKRVGVVRVNKDITHTKNNYECAAWWEERKSIKGIYPLLLDKKNSDDISDFFLYAKIDAKVTDDYFPALYCGVGGSNPYVSKHIGEDRKIQVVSEMARAIDLTGQSIGDIDYFVEPEFWPWILEERKERLKSYHDYSVTVWSDYEKGDDKYLSNISAVRYTAEKMNKVAGDIVTISEQISRINRDSQHMRDIFKENTAWAHTV